MGIARARKRHKQPVDQLPMTALDDERVTRNCFDRYKPLFLLVSLVAVVVMSSLWPHPPLSEHAQFWRDSSFSFPYEGYVILYQDKIRLDHPTHLNPVLLVLHGYPSSSFDWRRALPLLNKNFPRVVIPDLLGAGFSSKPRGFQYTVTLQADIVTMLMTSLNISRAHVLSHGYGDLISRELVARNGKLKIESLYMLGDSVPILPLNEVVNELLSYRIAWYAVHMMSLFGNTCGLSLEDLGEQWSLLTNGRGNLALSHVFGYLAEQESIQRRWALSNVSLPFMSTNSAMTCTYPYLLNERHFVKGYFDFLRREKVKL